MSSVYAGQLQAFRFAFRAMGSPCVVCLYARSDEEARNLSALAQEEALRIEHKYSRYRDDSIVAVINAAAGQAAVDVDDETAALLDYAAVCHEQSDGLFDVTSGVLRRAWDYKAKRVPTEDELALLLPLVGWEKVDWSSPSVRLTQPDMQLDFGGIGKEYAVDCAAKRLQDQGIQHGYVDFGGDVSVLGPHPDGSPWQIGIRHPRSPERAIARLPMSMGAIATSGDYERFFEHQGQRYCHILNPKTGMPSVAWSSVTVVAEHCLIAGSASTIGMLKPRADSSEWLNDLGLRYLAIDEHGDLHKGGVVS